MKHSPVRWPRFAPVVAAGLAVALMKFRGGARQGCPARFAPAYDEMAGLVVLYYSLCGAGTGAARTPEERKNFTVTLAFARMTVKG